MDHHDDIGNMGPLRCIAFIMLLTACASRDFQDLDAQRRAARIQESEAMFHKTHQVRRSCSPRRHRPRKPYRRGKYIR